MTMVISWQFSQILPRVPLTRPGGGVCFPLKSGVDPSKAEIFQRGFVMNMSLRKEQVCHLHGFLDGRIWKISPLGLFFRTT